MNTRILELAEQAGSTHKQNLGVYQFYTDELENFAALIVQECINCSTWVGDANSNPLEPVHTAHAINQRIKRHFGIE